MTVLNDLTLEMLAHVRRRKLDDKTMDVARCSWCNQKIDLEITSPTIVDCPHCGRETLFDENLVENVVYTTRMMSRADRDYLDWLSVQRGYEADYHEITSTL